MGFVKLRFALAAALALAALAVAAQPPADASTLRVLKYAAPVPPSWRAQPPTSRFRAAQYVVPAAPGATDAELVVFYFGRGQGGSPAANAERWASQFSRADGQPVRPGIETFTLRDLAVTVVELNGSYARGIGVGPIGQPRPGQTLLAAVIETPEGNVIVQLHGDHATVNEHRAAFVALLRGFRAD